MAEGEQDEEQKTEQPTQKRLDEALKKGNVPNSREVSSFFMLAALALSLAWLASAVFNNARMLLTPFLSEAGTLPTDAKGLGPLLSHAVFGGLGSIAAPLLATIIAALAGNLIQHGLVFSFEPITPKLEKISPLAGLKRLFSMRSVVELIKGILKIIVVGTVGFLAIYPDLVHLRQLPDSTPEVMLLFLSTLAIRMTIGVAIAMFFIAILDTIYQRFQYTKSLRMTRQEIKDEYKQSEGDPIVKQRLRRLRHERARKRMMAAVPTADVVITNPTHYAVALQYDTKTMKAPTVVAKGQDLIALKIREIAEENDVPVVENPPLARVLFSSTEIDEEIPTAQYEAVARVISYVYGLKGRKL